MARKPNPFKPTAGSDPPLLVGRGPLIDEFGESIEDGPGAPGRITIFTGPRGVGKTVMLNAVAERAQTDFQWQVIHETATPGLLQRLTARTTQLTPSARQGRSVTGVTLGGLGIELSPAPPTPELDLREALNVLLDDLESRETGLLVTIDEVHAGAKNELRQFAAVIQHLVREQREIAVAMAGIPSGVNYLLNDEVTTFLRRAEKHVLTDVALADVSEALASTIRDNGREITPDALAAATDATGGYPFMIQLVGYHVWRKAVDEVIDIDAARAGIDAARVRLGSLVHSTAMDDLSDVDRTFLLVMAQDSGPSRIEDIAVRMAKSSSYVSVYRNRLIDAGMIVATSRGCVDYAIPFLREYLREHGARYAMGPNVDVGSDG